LGEFAVQPGKQSFTLRIALAAEGKRKGLDAQMPQVVCEAGGLSIQRHAVS
jgi:hypothetical protein